MLPPMERQPRTLAIIAPSPWRRSGQVGRRPAIDLEAETIWPLQRPHPVVVFLASLVLFSALLWLPLVGLLLLGWPCGT